MFAVVNFDEESKKGIKKLFWRFLKKTVYTEKVSVAPGVFYFVLHCNFSSQRADWKLIEESAGAMKGRLIFPEGTKVPDNFTKSHFEKLRKTAFIKTARKILLSQRCKSVTIDDRNGEYIDYIESFVSLAPLIRVVTHSPERYSLAEERIMEKFGATLLICDENTELDNTWLITYTGGVWHGKGIKAITASDICYGAEKLIRLTKLCFNEEYLKLVPEKTDSEKFLSALYECSHGDFLGNTLFDWCKTLGT